MVEMVSTLSSRSFLTSFWILPKLVFVVFIVSALL